MKNAVLSTLFAFLLCSASVQIVGTPSGFAAGTTGGGNATPQTPSSLDDTRTTTCEWNRLAGSGTWPSLTGQGVLAQSAQYKDS
ncbi:uncharacterized protein ANIA_11333 [Aspergillus nidulans FGSC A4]|uniref:Uncharacterized protein n=1 Tax=Emericella nidulans (strain FGSC A4 / ATCC 38163 / CBS 112.46 / NRRL 194 / M139) TaxID=227321 RepID=C8VND8_EMENI|nr:hypothetical protein [Aspergillus nidulans FGSC A4]CBF86637.1 TPA: hypothetical protein ANIA_11333 [Aspergillus nidulans FGSC A4]